MEHRPPVKALLDRIARQLWNAADEATRLHQDESAALCLTLAKSVRDYADRPDRFRLRVPPAFDATTEKDGLETSFTITPVVADRE
jgi:hypothetical protein